MRLQATYLHLTAANVDTSSRTIRGRVVSYGEVGQTSIGPLTVQAGALELAEDLSRIKLFLDHDRTLPVGWAVEATDSEAGLDMAFRIAATPLGDQALAEANPDEPLRDGLSVELDQLELSDDETQVLAGILRGVALVPIPAFDSARVASVAASHTPNQEGTSMTTTETATAPAAVAAASAPIPAAAAGGPGTAAAYPSQPAAVPAGLEAAAGSGSRIRTTDQLYAALAAKHLGTASPEVLAALSDITQSGVGVDVQVPDYVGQLWDGVAYQRKVVPLISGPALTSYRVIGWKWTTKPVVAAWSGDKSDVPSNVPATDPVTVNASRLAGAHDIDRKFRDFNDTAFFEAYYAAMTDSYARLSDAAAVDALEAAATDIATPAYEGFLGAIAAGVAAIDDSTGAGSTFVLANQADLIPFALSMTNQDLPAMLQAIGVDLSRIVTHSSVTAGHVIVGTSAAVDFRELPGSPIRVEAVDMTKGGVDAGVFGYYAVVVHDADGIQDVTIDTGV